MLSFRHLSKLAREEKSIEPLCCNTPVCPPSSIQSLSFSFDCHSFGTHSLKNIKSHAYAFPGSSSFIPEEFARIVRQIGIPSPDHLIFWTYTIVYNFAKQKPCGRFSCFIHKIKLSFRKSFRRAVSGTWLNSTAVECAGVLRKGWIIFKFGFFENSNFRVS